MNKNNLASKDKRYIWHPFTEMTSWLKSEPLIIKKGKGALLWDIQGREYIDGVSSLWTNVHGHRVIKIDNAIKNQLDKIAHSTLLGLGNVPSILFAEALSKHLPGNMERIFYSDSGATAMEIAVKLAFAHWHYLGKSEKNTFIRFEGAYHGDTIGSVSVGGMDIFHKLYNPLLFEAPMAPYPFVYGRPKGRSKQEFIRDCYKRIEALVKNEAHRCGALIIEPLVQGAAGIRTAPKGFLKFLRRLCDENELLLIVDEVATGFGKTGKMFACEHEKVIPDLMAMAKGISGGYLPLAATAVSENIFNSFLGAKKDLRTFFHGHTYTGNPLACAGAVASLEIFESEKVINNLAPKIDALEKGLQGLLEHPKVGDVRNAGLMWGIELVDDKNERRPFDPGLKMGARVCEQIRNHQVITRPLGDVIVIMPPLCISKKQIEKISLAVAAGIEEATDIKGAL